MATFNLANSFQLQQCYIKICCFFQHLKFCFLYIQCTLNPGYIYTWKLTTFIMIYTYTTSSSISMKQLSRSRNWLVQ